LNELSIGGVVCSKRGRDKGRYFIIFDIDEGKEYVQIVDGCLRKVHKPKRKKVKHIHITPHVAVNILESLKEKKVSDSDIRKSLKGLGYEVSKED
jgi:large subunit ribosomal protein L14e